MANEKPDRLALDAAKAKAAGLSYGKWRAMQPVKETADEIPKNMKKCLYCEKAFVPKKGNQKYCCIYCQKEATKDRLRAQKAEWMRNSRQKKLGK